MSQLRWRVTLEQTLLSAVAPVIVGTCLLASGCRDATTTWSAEARSPDGNWLATARSQQWGGPGTAYDATSVSLKQGTQPAVEVLGFSHGASTMNVKMNWLTPRHFEVTYRPLPGDSVTLDLQMVRLADVDISLRRLSDGPPK